MRLIYLKDDAGKRVGVWVTAIIPDGAFEYCWAKSSVQRAASIHKERYGYTSGGALYRALVDRMAGDSRR